MLGRSSSGVLGKWETGATEPGAYAFSRPWSLVGTETIGINATGDSREKGSEDGRGRQYLSGDIRERTLE